MLTTRIKKIAEEHIPKYCSGDDFVRPVFLSILRTRAYTEVYKETEGEPLSIRRAKAFARYLETVPIFIKPHSLIVGFYAEDSHALPFNADSLDPKIIDEYIDSDNVKKEEVDEWHQYQEYWDKRSAKSALYPLLTDEEIRIASASHRYMECLPTRHTQRTQPDHDLYLKEGLYKIAEMLHKKLDRLYKEKAECTDGREVTEVALKINDVKAMIITAEAVPRWTNRYSQLAKKMAEEEKNSQRKEELIQIAEICKNVPGNPARTFWEAVQSTWFVFLCYQIIDCIAQGTSWRTDQLFWPWYEKDVVIDQTLPKGKALEIMENFLLNIDEIGLPFGLEFRKNKQGVNFLATDTIGGVKADGSDACNELTLLILDAMDDLRLSHPDFKFRWHPNVSPKVWKRVCEVVASGLGQPSIKNDPVIIDNLMDSYGFSLEDARSWACVGCISPAPTTHYTKQSEGAARRNAITVFPAKYLELALNNGVDNIPLNGKIRQVGPKTGDPAEFTSFEEVFEAFRKQAQYFFQKAGHIKALGEYVMRTLIKRPFASCLFRRSLDACRDITDVPEKSVAWMNDPGIVDSVDSLISIKKLVFEDRKYSMAELVKALKADWVGYEEMRQDFINTSKFGNNDDFADEVARQTYGMIAEEGFKIKDIGGSPYLPNGLVITWMFLCAPQTGALPNGRKTGDWLADGGISPHGGYDRNGPMAAVLSASKIDSVKQKANIFNQKLTPSSIEGEVGLKKFQSYIEAAMRLKLDMIQFNIVDRAMMEEAQKYPEQHQDLVVRVSGYNARFVHLSKFVQDAIIERTQHSLS